MQQLLLSFSGKHLFWAIIINLNCQPFCLPVNFIIFQISAILLLSKDQILSLISTRTVILAHGSMSWLIPIIILFQLFLIAIIVMSNPYVGYGRLVLFILKAIVIYGYLTAIAYVDS